MTRRDRPADRRRHDHAQLPGTARRARSAVRHRARPADTPPDWSPDLLGREAAAPAGPHLRRPGADRFYRPGIRTVPVFAPFLGPVVTGHRGIVKTAPAWRSCRCSPPATRRCATSRSPSRPRGPGRWSWPRRGAAGAAALCRPAARRRPRRRDPRRRRGAGTGADARPRARMKRPWAGWSAIAAERPSGQRRGLGAVHGRGRRAARLPRGGGGHPGPRADELGAAAGHCRPT